MPVYDPAKRRQAKRTGRERGVWVYLPATELEAAGIDPAGPAPFYRMWSKTKAKRAVLVQLYVEQ